MKKTFIEVPDNKETILDAIITEGLLVAKQKYGAKFGTMTAAIVRHGKVIALKAESIIGSIETDYDLEATWDDGIKGISYFGYVLGKLAQTVRTRKPSDEFEALGYGESDSEGSDVLHFFCYDAEGKITHFSIIAGFSGLESKEDFEVSHQALGAGWMRMSSMKNPNGSDPDINKNC